MGTNLRRIEKEVASGDTFGWTDGTTEVEVIPGPPDGYKRVTEMLRICNLDTVSHTIRVLRYDGVDYVEFDSAIDLEPDGKFDPIQKGVDEVRSQENHSVWIVMDEAMVTEDPTWIASWRDEPMPVGYP